MNPDKTRINFVKDIGPLLIETKAIQFGDFTLSSGKNSPYYIDLRVIPSFPDVFNKVVSLYVHTLKNLIGSNKNWVICGVPTSGLTFASVVAFNLKMPLIYVREKIKTYGTGKKIEGVFKSGYNIVVLDDLITSGGSIINTIDTLRHEGGKVDNVVVLIDRLQGGKKRLAEKGVKLNSIMDINELADLIYALNIIDLNQYENIKKNIEKI